MTSSLEITSQTLLDIKRFRVYIITNKIYFIIIYALLINFHNHFIIHLVRGNFCLFLLKYSDFPSQQSIIGTTVEMSDLHQDNFSVFIPGVP